MAEARSAGGAWRWLIAGEWRAFPIRFVLAVLAIAIGVALAFAVHVINRSAAEAFGAAVRSVSGGADLQVRSVASGGFDERVYPRLFRVDGVADASPVVQLDARIGEARVTLLGLDVLRALQVTPALVPAYKGGAAVDSAFDQGMIHLSAEGRRRTGLAPGDRATVRVGRREHVFTVGGDLPGVAAGQAVAVVDIAAAQWRFGRLGRIERVDLRLRQGAGIGRVRAAVENVLPGGTRLTDPEGESRRGDSLSRAYRVNLDMLALVALITGGFLVYSAQSLSVTRRLRQLALLRTLGLEKRDLVRHLVGEGAVLGITGAMIGLILGYGLAALVLRFVGADLGGGYFDNATPDLLFSPLAALLFFLFGVTTALAGSLAPALQAGRIVPAEALKDAGDPVDPRRRPAWRPALLLILAGTGAALLPAVNRLPLFGYIAVGLVLAGGVAAMPWLARTLLALLARIDTRRPWFDLALRRLLGAPSQAATALGGIVASTALMIAMAVMVTSFRGAVDDWLDAFLSADLYVGAAASEPLFDADAQRRLAGTPGVESIAFSKTVPLALDPELPSLALIVRPVGGAGYALPLIERARETGPGLALWLSEPAARIYRLRPGDRLTLPFGPSGTPGHVAGIWRDYARQQGAVVIDERDYVALTGDRDRSEAAVDLAPGATAESVRSEILRRLPDSLAGRVQVLEPKALRAEALRLFDRSFAITYGLEAIAILIGLAGVAATISAQAMARIKEFGMLRHVGMAPRQIVAMLAGEGALLGLIGAAAGIALGLGISQILIHVINPQSFNWTMTTRIPWTLLASVGLALVATSAGTAVLAGRRAVSRDAVRAVSEDW
ncbi:FtsX-like permease family protein [Sphingomonas sp. LY54]|uniref:FtsX-like permease family protein n=1 Tax=Sphingomonas sp. LY54 TaxID=3095343 RepID=UPI002D76C275|nr:FtsX-like permease family protein [Sphingomonas sp. LY54]WRP29594.1 FtsX-like permease family protein [Sphingomonas sp. LY54]